MVESSGDELDNLSDAAASESDALKELKQPEDADMPPPLFPPSPAGRGALSPAGRVGGQACYQSPLRSRECVYPREPSERAVCRVVRDPLSVIHCVGLLVFARLQKALAELAKDEENDADGSKRRGRHPQAQEQAVQDLQEDLQRG